MTTEKRRYFLQKLEIIKELSANKDVQQLAQLFTEFIHDQDKDKQLGFTADKENE